MMTTHPVFTTILYGLICGISFVPIHAILRGILPNALIFKLVIFGYLIGYAILLTRFQKEKLLSILVPMLFMFALIGTNVSLSQFLVISVGLFAWIRGICYPKHWLRMIISEFFICVGGCALVAYFNPYSTGTWALGIWMFFLVQSVYFIIFDTQIPLVKKNEQIDPFEKARKQAENILSEMG